MNVAIVGTGYVGLVTGVCLAERGNKVYCVDSNPDVVERMYKLLVENFIQEEIELLHLQDQA